MVLPQLVLLAAMPGAPQQAPIGPGIDDIVVTARPGSPAALLDPIAYLRRLCYDPLRLTGRFAAPEDDGDWVPLEAGLRARFGITDPATPAFGLADPAHGRTMLLKYERMAQKHGLIETRCTLAVIGGADDGSGLVAAIARLMGGPGTQRHVGEPDGQPRLPGWTQWLWTSGPARGAGRWDLVQGRGAARAAGTWLVVIDPDRFYADHDYVYIDLKVREKGRVPLAMVSLARITAAARR